MASNLYLPMLCAKCGENTPVVVETIQEQRRSISPWTLLTIFSGLWIYRHQSVTYPAPLCGTCYREFIARKNRRRIVFWMGWLMFGTGFLLAILPITQLADIALLASIAARFDIQAKDVASISLILLGLVVAMISPSVGKPDLAWTDGQRIHFHNTAFQKVFAKHNPDKV